MRTLLPVSSTSALTVALFLPALNLRPPPRVRVPSPLVGSIEPPVTLKVAFLPLTLALPTFWILIPKVFRYLVHPLLRVMVVLPLATGSGVAEAKGANASSANSAAARTANGQFRPPSHPRLGCFSHMYSSVAAAPCCPLGDLRRVDLSEQAYSRIAVITTRLSAARSSGRGPSANAGTGRPPQYPQGDGCSDGSAAQEAHRTIAPVVGPEDERVFTDSGIEIDPLYDEGDRQVGLLGLGSVTDRHRLQSEAGARPRLPGADRNSH